MQLIPKLVADWPKLAWVASIEKNANEVHVLHGPMVEVAENWIVEAVWDGNFADGDFDQTDLVFGSGIRLRGSHITFVSSGTTFDQLWYTTHLDKTYVANSLPALMAVAGIGLVDGYPHYRRDIHSIRKGLAARTKDIPTDSGTVSTVYYNNMRLGGSELFEVSKPDLAPDFDCYEDYRSYLFKTADRLRENLSSSNRIHQVSPLCGVSSGYDSCATAVVARQVGCTHTVSIKDSTSLWRGSDSGAPIAKLLGLSCTEYSRTVKEYPDEETVWAGCAWAGMLNWTLFNYPKPLCLFFTGCHGEKMWDRVDHDHPDPFVRRDIASLGFCEFRLHQGAWQCPIPLWGVRRSQQLKRITQSQEMVAWCLGTDYDKPIARRLVEEAGVPRTLFGQTKKNSVLPDPFAWPRSPRTQASFREYLTPRRSFTPRRWQAELIRRAAIVESLLHSNVFSRLGIKKRFRPWERIKPAAAIFRWANTELKRRYFDGLRRAEIDTDMLGFDSGSTAKPTTTTTVSRRQKSLR